MFPSQGPCAHSQLGYENQKKCWEYLHSQEAENNLLADEKVTWKSGAGSYLYIHTINPLCIHNI